MMREKGVSPLLKTLINRWFTDEFIANYPDIVEARIKQVVETPEEVFLSVFDIYAATEMLPWLPQLNCACLVMTGELDEGCSPVLNNLIADTLPNAELIILTSFNSPRSANPELLKSFLNNSSAMEHSPDIKLATTVEDALKMSLTTLDNPVVAAGSFYLVGMVMHLLGINTDSRN